MAAEIVPSTRAELERVGSAERWALEDRVDEVRGLLRDFNDDELRAWVEEGQTQTWIAEQVGRSQGKISERCRRLGIEPQHPERGGRPRKPAVIPPDNPPPPAGAGDVEFGPPGAPASSTDNDDEQIDDPGRRVRCPCCGHMVKPGDITAWNE